MNDLKPIARYLSPIAMVTAIGILVVVYIRTPYAFTLDMLMIMLALLAIWLQNIAK